LGSHNKNNTNNNNNNNAALLSVMDMMVNKNQQRQQQKLPRSERKALERQKKNRQQQQQQRPRSSASLDPTVFQLHSNAVSQLTPQSTADVVVRAIKRAQKNHDHHDLQVIAKFLIEECSVGFAYGYRGSLLARLAVAALRWENHVVAKQAIDIRRMEYRASMMPMESAAILRGLLRTHKNDTDAMEILQDELALPLEVGEECEGERIDFMVCFRICFL
jgi:hypothetical protein